MSRAKPKGDCLAFGKEVFSGIRKLRIVHVHKTGWQVKVAAVAFGTIAMTGSGFRIRPSHEAYYFAYSYEGQVGGRAGHVRTNSLCLRYFFTLSGLFVFGELPSYPGRCGGLYYFAPLGL